MSAELYILLLATAGTVSVPSTAGDEQAKDTASSAAEARGHKEAQAPSVLAPVESSQKGSRAPKKSTTTPNRWDATRNGARKGFLWGGSMTSLGYGSVLGYAFLASLTDGTEGIEDWVDDNIAGVWRDLFAVTAVGLTTLSTGLGALIGYSRAEAAPPAKGDLLISRRSLAQIPLLIGVWSHALVRERGTRWAETDKKMSVDSKRRSMLSFDSERGVRANTALFTYSTLSAFLYHYARPIGPNGMQLDLSASIATGQVEVVNGAGDVFRRIRLGAQSEGPLTVTWDGRDKEGQALAPGTYRIRAEGLDDQGRTVAISAQMLARRQSSWGQAGLLAAGSLVAGLSVPIVTRVVHGADERWSASHDGKLWRRACLAAVAGLLATEWGLSKFASP